MTSSAVPIWCAKCGGEIAVPGTMRMVGNNDLYHDRCSPFVALLAESQARYNADLEKRLREPDAIHPETGEKVTHPLKIEAADAVAFLQDALLVDSGKTREINLLTKENRDQADALAKLRAILSAVMDVEKAEPTGDPYDPASWTSSAKSVVAGSEHDRVREQLMQAHALLEWFAARKFTLQAKFDLYGPADTAAAMKDVFYDVERFLSREARGEDAAP